jgi:predicted metalloprotease with PDZ domain
MDDNSPSGAMGALEHSYSSLYFLPEANADRLAKTIRDFAAHEFLHIVTPLNIHSREIHDFDYIEPDMSQHLWLYEGVTEYSAMQVQVRNDLYDLEDFLDELREKLFIAERFPTVSFTEMSEKILEAKYEPMFMNVYYKGALIALCLDLNLIKYTDGEIDLRTLMDMLASKYGPDQPFEDEKLFDVITEMTAPEIRDFFKKYVEASEPLPLSSCLEWVGINYATEQETELTTFGNVKLAIDENEQIYVSSNSQMDEFGAELGYKIGDIITEFNGTEVNTETIISVFEDLQDLSQDDKVKVKVLRNVKGKEKEVKLKARARKIKTKQKHLLEVMDSLDQDQLRLRQRWLSN